jgi:methylated-DNA-[protein]-cysteine S-methyltransferase
MAGGDRRAEAGQPLGQVRHEEPDDDGRHDREDVMRRSKGFAPEDERFHAEIDTPLGLLRVVARGAAIVGLYHGEHHPPPPPALLGQTGSPPGGPGSLPGPKGQVSPVPEPTAAVLLQACRELKDYFDGSVRDFTTPIDLSGTPFQLSVWAALRRIPYGECRSYRDVAEQLGNPRMGRAIGAAVRANPVSIIVPGHRVVSSAGAVIGYAAGSEVKKALLDLERAGAQPGGAGSPGRGYWEGRQT